MPRQIEIPTALTDAMERQARQSLPLEACGLLAAAPAETDTLRIREFRPLPNLDLRPDHFRLDPIAITKVEHEWRRAGLRLAGVFHSHPEGRARPSAADAAAAWPELVYVILGLQPVAWTAWQREPAAHAMQPVTLATLD